MTRRILVALAAAALLAPAAASAAQPLRVSGGRLVDERGRTVVLHGVNVVYKRSPYVPNGTSGERSSFDADDVARLRAWGMNSIRLGISWAGLMPSPGTIDRGYLARVLAVSRLAERAGIYVLLDMHQDLYAERFGGNGAPDWAVKDDGIPFTSIGGFPVDYTTQAVGRSFTNFYENRDGIRTEFRRAWEAVARAVRGRPYVLGFDLLNEPSCELQVDPPCHIPPFPEAYSRWILPLYDDVIPALRRADPTHPSWYEEGVTANFGYPMLLGRSPLPPWSHRGAGLSHHVYCGTLYRSVPCSQQEPDAFREARSAARRNGAAPLMTEFGATEDLGVLRRLTKLADSFGEGWHYWQYKTYFDPTTAASSEPGGADAESIVNERGQVKRAKLRVLARVYPSRIAGSDATWSYDDARRTFTMSWRARRSGTTLVEVPPAVFPRGVRLSHSGGGPKAETVLTNQGLRVSSAQGRITVRLRPR